jgi:hypothetical protein
MSRGDPRLPPPDLDKRDLGRLIVAPSELYWRISHKDAPLLDWSDNAESRFSNPALPFKVLYIAEERCTAFWERFGEDLVDQDPASRSLSDRMLRERVWKNVFCSLPVRLLDLTGAETLREISADASTFLAPYPYTQKWAAALMAHPANIDGVIYASRLDTPKSCVALFSRVSSEMVGVNQAEFLPINDPEIMRILSEENIALV